MIHPTAIVHPHAQLDASCTVGPYAVIEEHIVLGPDCVVGPQVYLTGHTTVGARNQFHAGCVVGDAPQDLKYDGAATRLRIGDDNTFREHVTVHRSSRLEDETSVGNGNFFMANSHIGHNCRVGDHNILANGVLLAGHVTLADRVFLSGNCLIHQSCRVGRFALMQGGSAISKDLPPFCVARGDNGIAGLNTIGLRRAGFTAAQRLQLRHAYHRLFRSGRRLVHAVAALRSEMVADPLVLELLDFAASTRRGLCTDTSYRRGNFEPPGD